MKNLICTFFATLIVTGLFADNPLVTHIYTADPTARVFNDTLYIYPSHDINEHDGIEGTNGFMMADYHVFSSTDLITFTDHGVILSQNDVDWVDNNSYAMWAPDCIEKDGSYYFYFPGNFKVGVATSKSPVGPFIAPQSAINKANGIDPCPFIDDDGTSYLYFGGGESLKVMRMNDDMSSPDMEPIVVDTLPAKYKEGSFVFKRNDIYYFTFPHAPNGSEEIAYATGDNPLGPFTYKGVIMDRWTDGCWTNHHSIVEYKGQWYIFYHHKDLSGDETLRSMCADKLFFNSDGTIQKVTPTRRGIGVRKAYHNIQVDRFNSATGVSTPFFAGYEPKGLYVSDISNADWLQYNDVDFESLTYRSVSARVACGTEGGNFEVRANSKDGALLASFNVSNTGSPNSWQTLRTDINASVSDTNNLVLVFKSESTSNSVFNVNWIRFNANACFELSTSGSGTGSISINNKEVLTNADASIAMGFGIVW